MNRRLPLFWTLAIALLIADQLVKAWARANLSVHQSWPGGPLPGVFEITLSYNKGIAFGMLQGSALLMAPIAVVIAFFAIRTQYKSEPVTRWSTVALSLLLSGSIGNLIDRVANPKGVTDMFLLRLSHITGGRLSDFPVFNIADVCISGAMVMLFITWTFFDRKATTDEPAEPGPDPAESATL